MTARGSSDGKHSRRCEQGNTELAGTAQQVREQVDSAHRTRDILFALLGAHLSTPRVNPAYQQAQQETRWQLHEFQQMNDLRRLMNEQRLMNQ
jgi:hypothetical protein